MAFSHFLTSSHLQHALHCPITLYADDEASINIIKQNKTSSRSRHLDIPVTYSNEKLVRKYYTIHHINTKLNAADSSTKATSGPTHARHWNFLRGVRFYPPSSSHHMGYLRSSKIAIEYIQTNKRWFRIVNGGASNMLI